MEILTERDCPEMGPFRTPHRCMEVQGDPEGEPSSAHSGSRAKLCCKQVRRTSGQMWLNPEHHIPVDRSI